MADSKTSMEDPRRKIGRPSVSVLCFGLFARVARGKVWFRTRLLVSHEVWKQAGLPRDCMSNLWRRPAASHALVVLNQERRVESSCKILHPVTCNKRGESSEQLSLPSTPYTTRMSASTRSGSSLLYRKYVYVFPMTSHPLQK